jgi:hypothetical protein
VCLAGWARAEECGSAEGIDAGPRLRQWLEKRAAKCAEVEPYEPTFLEGQILAFEKAERPSIFALNLFGLYPRIQSIDHRSQYAGGLRLWRPDLGGSRLDLSGSAFWSLQGYQYYDAQVGFLPHKGKGFPLVASRNDDVFEFVNVRQDADRPFTLYGSFLYRWAPKFDFFGIGPDSRREDQADFRLQERLIEGVAGYRILPHLSVSARFGLDENGIGDGDDDELPQVQDVFDTASIPGYDHQPDFFRGSVGLIYDARDVAENPHRGGVIAAEWERYDPRGSGSDVPFDRLSADARLYVSLGHPQRVLALRAYASQDDPEGAGRVPFYLLAYAGSSHTLRAFDSQRFRGERLVVLQAEYRWEASPALELAAFVDSAAVAATRDDGLGAFRTDGGVGLRIKSHEAALLRADVAWGSEGGKFLLRFSPSF